MNSVKPPPRRKPLPMVIEGSVVRIPLTRGLEALVDLEDLSLAEGKIWSAVKKERERTFYAATNLNGKRPLLHRFLMKAGPGQIVDHKNGNGLDNRRENLRFATPSQSSMNRGYQSNNKTGAMGVLLMPNGKWQARICVSRKIRFLGEFKSFEEAAKARRDAEPKFFGEFARTTTAPLPAPTKKDAQEPVSLHASTEGDR